MQIELKDRGGGGRCVYCREDFGGEQAWTCPGCAARLHAECAAELSTCPSVGCARPTPSRSAGGIQVSVSAREELQPAGTWRGFLVVAALLLLPAGLGVFAAARNDRREREARRVQQEALDRRARQLALPSVAQLRQLVGASYRPMRDREEAARTLIRMQRADPQLGDLRTLVALVHLVRPSELEAMRADQEASEAIHGEVMELLSAQPPQIKRLVWALHAKDIGPLAALCQSDEGPGRAARVGLVWLVQSERRGETRLEDSARVELWSALAACCRQLTPRQRETLVGVLGSGLAGSCESESDVAPAEVEWAERIGAAPEVIRYLVGQTLHAPLYVQENALRRLGHFSKDSRGAVRAALDDFSRVGAPRVRGRAAEQRAALAD